MISTGNALRTSLALGLIAAGFLLDLMLVVLVLGEGIATARLHPSLAAVSALLGGGMLMAGLALIEPRRGLGELALARH